MPLICHLSECQHGKRSRDAYTVKIFVPTAALVFARACSELNRLMGLFYYNGAEPTAQHELHDYDSKKY